MEQVRTALAQLVALEARCHDLIDPTTQIGEATRNLVKAIAAEFKALHHHVHGAEPNAETKAAMEESLTLLPPEVPQPMKVTITPPANVGTDGPGS